MKDYILKIERDSEKTRYMVEINKLATVEVEIKTLINWKVYDGCFYLVFRSLIFLNGKKCQIFDLFLFRKSKNIID